MPDVSIFLDARLPFEPEAAVLPRCGTGKVGSQVDDLESIDALEEYIDGSQMISLFCSKGYYLSRSDCSAFATPASFTAT